MQTFPVFNFITVRMEGLLFLSCFLSSNFNYTFVLHQGLWNAVFQPIALKLKCSTLLALQIDSCTVNIADMLKNFKQLQRSLTPHTVPQRADDEKTSSSSPSPCLPPAPFSWRDVLIKNPFLQLFRLVHILTKCLITIDSHLNKNFYTQWL